MARNRSSTPLDREQRLKLLDILYGAKDKEADRFWVRFNTVFVINSALFTAVFLVAGSEKFPRQIDLGGIEVSVVSALSLVGMVVSTLWTYLLISAKHYETRIIRDIDNTLKDDETLKGCVKGYSDRASGTWLPKATTYAQLITVVFSVLWLLILRAKW